MKKYKLIKEYPGSPEVGFISNNEGGCSHYHKNYPEFWEEVVEKEYEILTVTPSKNNIIYNPFEKIEPYYSNDEYNDHWQLYSVKRLSDNEVFTVGDKIDRSDGRYKNDIIRGFNIGSYGNCLVSISDSIDNGYYEKKGCNISIIEHSKKPLFTTEDGVDIFEGDKVSYINYLDTIMSDITFRKKTEKHDLFKWFSTKEAAEEYVLMNKACLSINDINFNWAFNETNKLGKFVHGSGTIQNLIKLVKKRL